MRANRPTAYNPSPMTTRRPIRAASYAGDPPPNAASLTLGPALLGLGVLILGGALTAGGIAVFGEVRRARLVTGILSAIAAALSASGALLAMANPPPDVVLAIALTVG